MRRICAGWYCVTKGGNSSLEGIGVMNYDYSLG